MRWPTDQDWRAWEISADLEKLFYLRWLELFSATVLDTWQVRTINVRGALEEILNVIEVSETHPVYKHNLPFVVAEAHALAIADPVVHDKYPFVCDYLAPFTKQRHDAIDAEKLRAICRQLSAKLREYGAEVVERICQLIDGKANTQKDLLQKLSLCLATELRSRGYSMDHLSNTRETLQNPAQGSFPDRVRAVWAKCSGATQQYTCFVHVNFPGTEAAGQDPDVSIVSGVDAQQSAGKGASLISAPDGRYARIRVVAVDPGGAVSTARERLARLLAAHSFYEPEKVFSWREDEAIVVSDAGAEARRFSAVRSYLRNTKNPASKVGQLLKILAEFASEDRERLSAALEYHRLASTAPSDEARLVNLWIALETLARHSDDAIIKDVCGIVPATIALGYPFHLLTGLAIQVRAVPRFDQNQALRRILTTSTRARVDPARLLSLLLAPKSSDDLAAFYSELGDLPLLVNRVFSVREKMFKSPGALVSELERHKTNVDWQIRRIYRARNQVMHQATRPRHLGQLIQHLHTYFAVTLGGLVRGARDSARNTSVWEALEQRQRLYEYLIFILKSDRKHNVTQELLLDPDRLLGAWGDTPAWPAAVS